MILNNIFISVREYLTEINATQGCAIPILGKDNTMNKKTTTAILLATSMMLTLMGLWRRIR